MSLARLRSPIVIHDYEAEEPTRYTRVASLNEYQSPVHVRCRCGASGKANRKLVPGRKLEKCRECS